MAADFQFQEPYLLVYAVHLLALLMSLVLMTLNQQEPSQDLKKRIRLKQKTSIP
jgi:hypothetical protein